MTMLTIDQLSYLLKFALQKIKQPGVSKYVAFQLNMAYSKVFNSNTPKKKGCILASSPFFFLLFFEQTEPFQKPVSLEQHPDYAEYIFHPMDLSTLEKVTVYGQNDLLDTANPCQIILIQVEMKKMHHK